MKQLRAAAGLEATACGAASSQGVPGAQAGLPPRRLATLCCPDALVLGCGCGWWMPLGLGWLNCVSSSSYKKTQETLSQAGQKTSAALSTMGSAISRKLGDMR